MQILKKTTAVEFIKSGGAVKPNIQQDKIMEQEMVGFNYCNSPRESFLYASLLRISFSTGEIQYAHLRQVFLTHIQFYSCHPEFSSPLLFQVPSLGLKEHCRFPKDLIHPSVFYNLQQVALWLQFCRLSDESYLNFFPSFFTYLFRIMVF